MNNKRITLEGGSYETPATEIVEVHSEGILCSSGTPLYENTHEGWTEDPNKFTWD